MTLKIFILFLISLTVQASDQLKTLNGVALTSTGQVRKWKSLPIQICTNSSVPAKFKKSISNAAAAWNKQFSKTVFNVDCTSKGKSDSENVKDHSIFWVKKNFSKFSEKTRLATTQTSFNEDTGELIDADIYINSEFYHWEKLKVDFETIIVHELGHVLGIQHNFLDPESAMNYYSYASGIQFRNIGEFEKNAVKATYFSEKLNPDKQVDLFLSGNIYQATAELTAKSQKTNKDNYALAIMHIQNKKLDLAKPLLERMIENGYAPELVAYKLGETEWELNNTEGATKRFHEVLKLNPIHYESMASLAAIEFGNGNIKKAKELFEKVLEINPTHYIACIYLDKIKPDVKYKKCIQIFEPS